MTSLLMALFLMQAPAPQQPSCSAPLSREQLERLIAGKVAQTRLIQLVTMCGVDFPSDGNVEASLRKAGASDALVAAVRWANPVKNPANTKSIDTGIKLGPRLLGSGAEPGDANQNAARAMTLEKAPDGSRAATAFILWLHALTLGDFAHMDRVATSAAAFARKMHNSGSEDSARLLNEGEKALKENRTDDAVELLISGWASSKGKLPQAQSAHVIDVIRQQTGFDLSRYGDRMLRLLDTSGK